MHPVTYWGLGCISWLALITYLAARGRTRKTHWQDSLIFFALTCEVFLVDRWPVFFNPMDLNPDEAQMAAQAIKSLSDPLPWHGFDGTTSGPLDSYILTIPHIIGQPITMQSTHVIAAALELGTVFAFQGAIGILFGSTVARAAALIPLAFYTFAQDNNFVHYSSEHLPIFLIACGLCALAHVRVRSQRQIAACVVGGSIPVLGLFAKLQCTLLVIYVAIVLLLVLLTTSESARQRQVRLRYFLTGGFGTLAFAIAVVAASGTLNDAFVSYVLANVAYSHTSASLGTRFFFLIDPMYPVFVYAAISLFVLFGYIAIWSRPIRYFTEIVMFAGGLTVIGIWTVRLANHPFQHYLVFAIIPMAFLVAAIAGAAYGDRQISPPETSPKVSRMRKPTPSALIASIAAILIVPSLLQQLVFGNSFAHDAPAYLRYHDRMVTGLRHIMPENSRVAIWGWMPQYYVYTQTSMATKDAHTYAEIVPGPYREYFRKRYLAELSANPPTYFVDAVAPSSFGFTDRKAAGIETFPQLAAFVSTNYALEAELNGVRIYRRKPS